MRRKVRFGIIGCGQVFRIMYGPTLRFLEKGECTAAMDPDRDALAWVRDNYGIAETYTSLDQMLAKSDVEALVVGSPVFEHCDQVRAAAQAGKHVLCEKPMAPTVRECRDMIQSCKQNGVVLMVGFMKRFNKCFNLAKEMIDAGELGNVFQIRTDWSWFAPKHLGWRDSLRTGGGLYQDHGSHITDLCRWWVGDVSDVSGYINIVLPQREVEDQAVVVYRHRGGAISVHCQTRMTHLPLNEYYQICGAKGTLEIQFGPGWSFRSLEPFRMTLHQEGNHAMDITPYSAASVDEELKQRSQYLLELEHFCECARDGAQPITSGEDGLKAIEAINAVYLSSARKETISLPLTEDIDAVRLFASMKTNRP